MRQLFTYSYGHYGDIDDLELEYDGNQLRMVTDGCDELSYAGAMDFKDGSDAQTEYSWDANGNTSSTVPFLLWRWKVKKIIFFSSFVQF